MGNNQSKFRIIEKQRKLVTYQITDSEMDNLGSLSRIEQVMLNAVFACVGLCCGTLVTIFSGEGNVAVWTTFFVALILSITLGIAFICTLFAIKKMKKDIREY